MIEAAAVIPVRLNSTRIARKVLADLGGMPILWHVWQQVRNADCFQAVVVATESMEIFDLVESWGGTAILTRPGFVNGTERIASIAASLKNDLVVNVQADMPRIDRQVFLDLLHAWTANPVDVITPVFRLRSINELRDSNLVKVARAENGYALYFSRHPIPYLRDTPIDQWLSKGEYWGHVGIYGFTKSALRNYTTRGPGVLETAESLEQLRFLEAGISIMTSITTSVPNRIDSLDDLVGVRESLLRESHFCDAKSTV